MVHVNFMKGDVSCKKRHQMLITMHLPQEGQIPEDGQNERHSGPFAANYSQVAPKVFRWTPTAIVPAHRRTLGPRTEALKGNPKISVWMGNMQEVFTAPGHPHPPLPDTELALTTTNYTPTVASAACCNNQKAGPGAI